MNEIPYKLIRSIAKKNGFDRIHNFTQRDTDIYQAEHRGKKIIIDVQKQEVYVWNSELGKLIKQ